MGSSSVAHSDNLLDKSLFMAVFFPVSLPHFPINVSWDHLPNKLLRYVFLSEGLFLREPRLIQHSINSYGMNEKVIFSLSPSQAKNLG